MKKRLSVPKVQQQHGLADNFRNFQQGDRNSIPLRYLKLKILINVTCLSSRT